MRKISSIMLMVFGIALALQPLYAGLASFNGATVGGIAILCVGAHLFNRSNTTEYSSTS